MKASFMGVKCLIQQFSLQFDSINNILPHIFFIYRIIYNSPLPCLDHALRVHWNPIGGKKIRFSLTLLLSLGEGFHSNARLESPRSMDD